MQFIEPRNRSVSSTTKITTLEGSTNRIKMLTRKLHFGTGNLRRGLAINLEIVRSRRSSRKPDSICSSRYLSKRVRTWALKKLKPSPFSRRKVVKSTNASYRGALILWKVLIS